MKRRNSEFIEGSPRGAVRSYADARRLSLIDPHIAPLVETMNVPGLMHTVACCEGHGSRGGLSIPYVSFKAPVVLAGLLHKRLEGDAMQANPWLKFYWVIEGYFDGDHRLVFRLTIPRISLIDDIRYGGGRIWRKGLDEDFSTLGGMVVDVVSGFKTTSALHKPPCPDLRCTGDGHVRGRRATPALKRGPHARR